MAELHELQDMFRYSVSDFGSRATGLRALRLLCTARGELRQFLMAVEALFCLLVVVLLRVLKVVSLLRGFVWVKCCRSRMEFTDGDLEIVTISIGICRSNRLPYSVVWLLFGGWGSLDALVLLKVLLINLMMLISLLERDIGFAGCFSSLKNFLTNAELRLIRSVWSDLWVSEVESFKFRLDESLEVRADELDR